MVHVGVVEEATEATAVRIEAIQYESNSLQLHAYENTLSGLLPALVARPSVGPLLNVDSPVLGRVYQAIQGIEVSCIAKAYVEIGEGAL